jgi:DNA-binding protein HU-beta
LTLLEARGAILGFRCSALKRDEGRWDGGRRDRAVRLAGCGGRIAEHVGGEVNKIELIEHVAKHADISKAAAGRAIEAVVGGIRTSLKKGNSVTLVGFGTFSVSKRAARAGRNPRTGAAIKIKAAKVPKFRPGKALKDAVN